MNNQQVGTVLNPMELYRPKAVNEDWDFTLTSGSMGNYPRPSQGLPMFKYGLIQQEQQKLDQLYKKVSSS